MATYTPTKGRPRYYSDEEFRRADQPHRTTAQVAAILGCTPNAVRCFRHALRLRGAKVVVRHGGRPAKALGSTEKPDARA